ncbi:MAG: UDP-glucose 4-epimerase [Rickettsiales bacterium]|jgi:UDP-glucose 4-epimerase
MQEKNNTILITGGCGFIGSAVVRRIRNDKNLQHYKLIIVDNLAVGKKDNIKDYADKIEFHQIDIRSKEDLDPLFEKCDYVIHLAANVSIQKSIEDPSYSHSVNLSGFINVLELSKKHHIRNIVYASSAAVYGDLSQELSEYLPIRPISPYGFEKMADEYYAKFYKQYHNVKSVGLRFFNVYGAGNHKDSDYAGVIKIFGDAIENNEEIKIYGDGSQTRDFIFLEDVADVVVKSLIGNLQGVFNLATGNSISILDLAKTMQKVAGKELPINFLSKKNADILISRANIDKIKSAIKDFSTLDIFTGLSKIKKNDNPS